MMDARRLQGAAGEIKSLQSICGDHRDITAREPHHYSFVQSRPPSVPVQQRSVILAPIAPALSPACSALGSTRDSALDGHATPLWIHPSPSHCPRHTCSATAASIQPSTAIQTLASTHHPSALDALASPLGVSPLIPTHSPPLRAHRPCRRWVPTEYPSPLVGHADAAFHCRLSALHAHVVSLYVQRFAPHPSTSIKRHSASHHSQPPTHPPSPLDAQLAPLNELPLIPTHSSPLNNPPLSPRRPCSATRRTARGCR